MNGAVIEVNGLAKSYGELVALNAVSLTVAARTACGGLGTNGSGKTTTVSIPSNALGPDGGSAGVCGLGVVFETAAVRSVVGFAAKFTAVDPNLSGRENLVLIGPLSQLASRSARKRASASLPDPPTGARRRARRRVAAPDLAQRIIDGVHQLHRRDAERRQVDATCSWR